MNDHRYRNYLFVLEVLESDIFSQPERDVLADAAEGLLLTRLPSSEEAGEIGVQVSAVLDDLVTTDRLRYATAVELRARIAECGPRRRGAASGLDPGALASGMIPRGPGYEQTA